MTASRKQEELLNSLESAVALLQTLPSLARARLDEAAPLPSLLEQCQAWMTRKTVPVVRSIHHFAATGGTLMSRCIDAQPNVVLLSEIDPLSLISMTVSKPVFSPRSVIQQLRYSVRGNCDVLIGEVFQAEIVALRDRLQRQGRHLVVRDHAHSQYCFGPISTTRKSVLDLLRATGDTRSIVTIRHPIDSFLSITAQPNWNHFSPATLEEYCRRYLLFLEDHAGLPIISYEAFVADPERVTAEICSALDLAYIPGAIDLRDVFKLSGDSGRAGTTVAERPRRAVSPEVHAQAGVEPYLRLCQRLGYDPALS